MKSLVPFAKICRRCEHPFEAWGGKAIYCSDRCGKSARRIARRIHPVQKSCALCRAMFVPKRKMSTRFCSPVCGTKANRLSHPDRQRDQLRTWRQANPERARMHTNARRALILNAPGSYTDVEWRALVEFWSGTCSYCGMSSHQLEPDHRVPLVRGGSNDIENIIPACRSCNAGKNTRTEQEYRTLRVARLQEAA